MMCGPIPVLYNSDTNAAIQNPTGLPCGKRKNISDLLPGENISVSKKFQSSSYKRKPFEYKKFAIKARAAIDASANKLKLCVSLNLLLIIQISDRPHA